MNVVSYLRLKGLVNYGKALSAQEHIAAEIQRRTINSQTPPHVLLLLEHKPVYTAGRRLLKDSKELSEMKANLTQTTGADFYEVRFSSLWIEIPYKKPLNGSY
jgi:lipoate-protein ligase B